MTNKQRNLIVGAIKSFVAGATGMIVSLNVIDPEHFNVMTFGGWKHLGAAVLIAAIGQESRYLNQWATSGEEKPPIVQ